MVYRTYCNYIHIVQVYPLQWFKLITVDHAQQYDGLVAVVDSNIAVIAVNQAWEPNLAATSVASPTNRPQFKIIITIK